MQQPHGDIRDIEKTLRGSWSPVLQDCTRPVTTTVACVKARGGPSPYSGPPLADYMCLAGIAPSGQASQRRQASISETVITMKPTVWLFSLVLAVSSPVVRADECQPVTWASGTYDKRAAPTGAMRIIQARDGPAIGGANLSPGDINCRFPGRTYEVNYYTCIELSALYEITLEHFFTLNPGLATDCSNIQPDTEYCVAGCKLPHTLSKTSPPISITNQPAQLSNRFTRGMGCVARPTTMQPAWAQACRAATSTPLRAATRRRTAPTGPATRVLAWGTRNSVPTAPVGPHTASAIVLASGATVVARTVL